MPPPLTVENSFVGDLRKLAEGSSPEAVAAVLTIAGIFAPSSSADWHNAAGTDRVFRGPEFQRISPWTTNAPRFTIGRISPRTSYIPRLGPPTPPPPESPKRAPEALSPELGLKLLAARVEAKGKIPLPYLRNPEAINATTLLTLGLILHAPRFQEWLEADNNHRLHLLDARSFSQFITHNNSNNTWTISLPSLQQIDKHRELKEQMLAFMEAVMTEFKFSCQIDLGPYLDMQMVTQLRLAMELAPDDAVTTPSPWQTFVQNKYGFKDVNFTQDPDRLQRIRDCTKMYTPQATLCSAMFAPFFTSQDFLAIILTESRGIQYEFSTKKNAEGKFVDYDPGVFSDTRASLTRNLHKKGFVSSEFSIRPYSSPFAASVAQITPSTALRMGIVLEERQQALWGAALHFASCSATAAPVLGDPIMAAYAYNTGWGNIEFKGNRYTLTDHWEKQQHTPRFLSERQLLNAVGIRPTFDPEHLDAGNGTTINLFTVNIEALSPETKAVLRPPRGMITKIATVLEYQFAAACVLSFIRTYNNLRGLYTEDEITALEAATARYTERQAKKGTPAPLLASRPPDPEKVTQPGL